MWAAKKVFNLFLKIVAPARCLSCDRLGAYFCAPCLAETELIVRQKCPVCERHSPGGLTHPGCEGRYTPDGLFSLFEYKGAVRRAITLLKFRGLTDIRRELKILINHAFQLLYEKDVLFELEDFITFDAPFFIPVPLHWWRRMGRGFNQAEFVGKLFAAEYDRPLVPALLTRNRYTLPQAKLKGKERTDNLKHAFKVRKMFLTEPAGKDVEGNTRYKLDTNLRNIVLIDDVTTTGSTLLSAANTLKRAGASKVWGLTLAQ